MRYGSGTGASGMGCKTAGLGGENYEGARSCDFDWVRLLAAQCRAHDVTFAFTETGTVFVKDGKTYRLRDHRLQSEQAYKSGVSRAGRSIETAAPTAGGAHDPKGDSPLLDHARSVTYAIQNLMSCRLARNPRSGRWASRYGSRNSVRNRRERT